MEENPQKILLRGFVRKKKGIRFKKCDDPGRIGGGLLPSLGRASGTFPIRRSTKYSRAGLFRRGVISNQLGLVVALLHPKVLS
jgi:hypothetical protein